MALETTVLLDGLGFPECPRWHEGKLWFSDMTTRHVMTVNLDGNPETIVRVPEQPAGLGWLPDGRLLVVSSYDRRLLRLDPEGLVSVADLGQLTSYICNDMVVDRQGRAYVGNFGWDYQNPAATPRLAEVVLVLPDGEARIVASEMAFPNGSVITPDDRTLIVAESCAARLSAFSIAPDGSLSGRRTWAQFDERGFALAWDRVIPDGICLDAKGAIWVASPGNTAAVLRVLEGGEVTDRIPFETQPIACMLGGPDRCTLFVLASTSQAESARVGRIETVRVEVPGAGQP